MLLRRWARAEQSRLYEKMAISTVCFTRLTQGGSEVAYFLQKLTIQPGKGTSHINRKASANLGTNSAEWERRAVGTVRIFSQQRWIKLGPWGSESYLKMQGGGGRVNYKSFLSFDFQVSSPVGSLGVCVARKSVGKGSEGAGRRAQQTLSPRPVFCPIVGPGPNHCGQSMNRATPRWRMAVSGTQRSSALCVTPAWFAFLWASGWTAGPERGFEDFPQRCSLHWACWVRLARGHGLVSERKGSEPGTRGGLKAPSSHLPEGLEFSVLNQFRQNN